MTEATEHAPIHMSKYHIVKHYNFILFTIYVLCLLPNQHLEDDPGKIVLSENPDTRPQSLYNPKPTTWSYRKNMKATLMWRMSQDKRAIVEQFWTQSFFFFFFFWMRNMREIVGLASCGIESEGNITPYRLLHLDMKSPSRLWNPWEKILVTGFIIIQISELWPVIPLRRLNLEFTYGEIKCMQGVTSPWEMGK